MPTAFLPALDSEFTSSRLYHNYARELARQGFSGAIVDDFSSRLAYANDNSVYQIAPQLILKPANTNDVVVAMRLLQHPDFVQLQLTARGGGTGTNAQSLSSGCVLDTSVSLNKILELNLDEAYAVVEPGVTLQELNAAAGEHGLKFGPLVSTADRATIGGMVNTDACGKGSCVYGKCSDHLLEAEMIGVGGKVWQLREWKLDDIDIEGEHYQLSQLLHNIQQKHRAEIFQRFPKLNREATGYNLQQMVRGRSIRPLKLIAGAEGSLGVLSKIKVRLVPIPKHTSVCIIAYEDFYHTLCSGVELRALRPDAIETMDKTLVQLSLQTPLAERLGELLPTQHSSLGGINCVELSASSPAQLKNKQRALAKVLQDDIRVIHHHFADPASAKLIWRLRAQAVGVLGRLDAYRQPISGIEDCALPPEKIPDFVLEMQGYLNARDLSYGIYGHIDAGCLHLRPALDTRSGDYRKQLRAMSDFAYQLCRQHGGIFWGEHGKGVRSEYARDYFGERLYQQMQRIKAYFDPRNQLNPGKVATPSDSGAELLRIDQVPMKIDFDRQVMPSNRGYFEQVFSCNGNGACFSSNLEAQMCPSYQLTHDRVHSPKGRAALMREWLRLLSLRDFDIKHAYKRWPLLRRSQHQHDFSHQVADAMHGCLGCSACASACPVQLSVPDIRSTFLHIYHSRYRRRWRDHLIARLESLSTSLAPAAHWVNWLSNTYTVRRALEGLGLVDIPRFDQPLQKKLNQDLYSEQQLHFMLASRSERTVVLLADPYLNAYDNQPLLAAYKLLAALGWQPRVFQLKALGKAAHVLGMLHAHSEREEVNKQIMLRLREAEVPALVLEPSALYFLRGQELAGASVLNHPAHWLLEQELPTMALQQTEPLRLLRHCTEASQDDGACWRKLYQRFGLELEIVNVGCCGRAGLYGHLREHREGSFQLYQRNWQQQLHADAINLATGFSCRAQGKLLQPELPLEHPLAYLQRLVARHEQEANLQSLPAV